jgi:hypothetical protein
MPTGLEDSFEKQTNAITPKQNHTKIYTYVINTLHNSTQPYTTFVQNYKQL